MSRYYTKKGGQRVDLSTISDDELTVIRTGLAVRIVQAQKDLNALKDNGEAVEQERRERINAKWQKQREARESQWKQSKISKVVTAMNSGGRKFKEA
jgi:hypothetical protein